MSLTGLRAPRPRPVAASALAAAAGIAAEPRPAGRSPEVLTAPEDRRTPDQTFLTFPEWYLVHSPAEYARYLSRSEPPSAFPLFAHIGQFWQGYARGQPRGGALSVQRRLSPDGDGHRQQHDRRVRPEGHLRAHHRPARRGDGQRRRVRARGAPLRRLRPGLRRLHPPRALVQVRLPRAAEAALVGAAAVRAEPDPALGAALRAHHRAARQGRLCPADQARHPVGVRRAQADHRGRAGPRPRARPAAFPDYAARPTTGPEVLATMPRYEPFTAYSRWLAAQGVDFREIAGNDGEILRQPARRRTAGRARPGAHAVRAADPHPARDRSGSCWRSASPQLAALLRSFGEKRGGVVVEHIYDF